MDTLPLGITHRTHVLQGAVCPFHHWAGYFHQFLTMSNLISIHLGLPLVWFMTVLSKVVRVVILAGIPAVLTDLPHLIILAVPLVPLPIPITLDVFVPIV